MAATMKAALVFTLCLRAMSARKWQPPSDQCKLTAHYLDSSGMISLKTFKKPRHQRPQPPATNAWMQRMTGLLWGSGPWWMERTCDYPKLTKMVIQLTRCEIFYRRDYV